MTGDERWEEGEKVEKGEKTKRDRERVIRANFVTGALGGNARGIH